MDGSFQVLGQRALKPETFKELVIDIYSLGNLGQGLPFSHFTKQLPFVWVKSWWIGEILAA